MSAEYYARIGIYSQTLTPSQVSAILGLECDKGYEKGNIVRPHGIVQRKEHQWFIYSRIPRSVPLEDHVKDVLDRVSGVTEKICALAKQPATEIELGCVIHSKESPALVFSTDVVVTLCKMGASIDVDLYYWERDGEHI